MPFKSGVFTDSPPVPMNGLGHMVKGVDCTYRSNSPPPMYSTRGDLGGGPANDYKPSSLPPQAYGAVTVDTQLMSINTARGMHSNPLHTRQEVLAAQAGGIYRSTEDLYGKPTGSSALYGPSTQPLLTIGTDGKGVLRADHQDHSIGIGDLKDAAGLAPRVTWAIGNMPQRANRSSVEVSIDFTRADLHRTRPLLLDGKSLYVCEHYMSIWSPVLKAFIIECPNRELILPNIRYEQMLEVLEIISPMHKEVTEKNLHYILPIASELQMDGLLHKCEIYLIDNLSYPILEKLWLGDRYKMKRLTQQCLVEIRPQSKIDISGPKYYTLSDRIKVQVLERIHGAKPPDPVAEEPKDCNVFSRMSDTQYCTIKGSTGRTYFCNPYYLAGWSNVVSDRMSTQQQLNEIATGCSQEELKLFLMAIYPPQLRISEHNVAPILMAACKLESIGLMKRCANMILNPLAQLTIFAKLSLLDRCFMHELLEAAMRQVRAPEACLDMTQQQTYDCLSVRARSAILDRLADLMKNPGMAPHKCYRCHQSNTCDSINWVCTNCGSYCAAGQCTDGQTVGMHQPPQKMGANMSAYSGPKERPNVVNQQQAYPQNPSYRNPQDQQQQQQQQQQPQAQQRQVYPPLNRIETAGPSNRSPNLARKLMGM